MLLCFRYNIIRRGISLVTELFFVRIKSLLMCISYGFIIKINISLFIVFKELINTYKFLFHGHTFSLFQQNLLDLQKSTQQQDTK